jgi:pimeloyl-ACP methyl ester carboxylesterase
VRQAASGSFAHLSDGFTHYEIAGLGSSRVVVLIHGFSVPYYLWDKTFDPLGRAGFCVLRYDLYGCGLSDRPHEHYNADLYDRQLSELLTSLRVQTPVDLVGASRWFDRGDLCGSTSGENAHTCAIRSRLLGR